MCDGGAWRRPFRLALKIRCAVFQICFFLVFGERLSDSGLSTYPRRLGVSHPFFQRQESFGGPITSRCVVLVISLSVVRGLVVVSHGG